MVFYCFCILYFYIWLHFHFPLLGLLSSSFVWLFICSNYPTSLCWPCSLYFEVLDLWCPLSSLFWILGLLHFHFFSCHDPHLVNLFTAESISAQNFPTLNHGKQFYIPIPILSKNVMLKLFFCWVYWSNMIQEKIAILYLGWYLSSLME